MNMNMEKYTAGSNELIGWGLLTGQYRWKPYTELEVYTEQRYVPEKMRSANYLNMWNDLVFPSMDFLFPDGRGMFQDASARILLAQTVKVWFTRH